MSAQFIICYAGGYLDIPQDLFVSAEQATVFTSEPDAWYAAYKAGLNPMHCSVVPRDAAMAKDAPAEQQLRPTK